LRVDDEALFESGVIVEYLEETQAKPLHPKDPLTRAKHRAWMEFGSSILADLWVFETTRDEAAFNGKVKTIREKFERLEGQLGEGPTSQAKSSASSMQCLRPCSVTLTSLTISVISASGRICRNYKPGGKHSRHGRQ
jgi:hypothetical protein